jgi:CRP/FNR family cyclic AMP-dependent transcriptional regulator
VSRKEIPTAAAAIVAQTFLAKLPTALVARIMEGGYQIDLDAGAAFGRSQSAVGIVLDGLIRLFLESPGGRQVTVRYARPGDTLGLVHLFGGATAVRAQALSHVSVWVLVASRLRDLALDSGPLATAIAEECAARAADAIEELGLGTFGTVRQRVARHLLDLAAAQQQGGELVAAVTQQELADACGSVREVVARVLKELRMAGLTAGSDSGVIILDAAALDVEVTGRGRPQ